MEPCNLPERKIRNRRSRSKGSRERNYTNREQILSSMNQFKQGNEKILNATDESILLNVAEVFADMLNLVEVNDEVYESLLNLHSIIKKKLAAFECTNEDNTDGTSRLIKLQSASLSSSMQSLCSVSSLSKDHFDEGDPQFKEFLIRVNCPFCYKPQSDKMQLIKHLDETCQTLMNDTFGERSIIPFAAFQILPNNTIKCNICQNSIQKSLKNFFVHKQSPKHASQYAKAAKLKKYTEFLFCSCCKVLVPNNYTQVDFHINHEVHKSRSMQNKDFNGKYITCVYVRGKKFKCLVCPSKPTFQSLRDTLLHFEDQTHRKHGKKDVFPRVYCEFCMKEVLILELNHHFVSADHANKEKAEPVEEWFELCYFCGFTCASLKELSLHMKKQCKEIMSIKGKNIVSAKLNNKKTPGNEISKKLRNLKVASTESKTLVDSYKITQGDVGPKEGLHIIIKDSTDVPEIYKYFQKFGEITGVDIHEEKNVLIQFSQKRTVDDVLLLRDVIQINGVKMEVTTIEELIKPMNTNKESEEEISSKKTTQCAASRQNDVKISDKTESDSSSDDDTKQPLMKLEILFQRVSHHLSSTAKIFDCNLQDQILEDCSKIFGQDKCSVVGFAACNLSFPVESIKIYCDVEKSYKTTGYSSSNQGNLIGKFYSKLREAVEWEAVLCQFDQNFPHIECKHKATQKMCAFTFMPSAKIITNILRDCIQEEHLTEKFVLIVRFWFSVRELKRPASEFAIISLLIFFIMNEKVVGNFLNLPASDMPYNTLREISAKYRPLTYSVSPLRTNGVARTFQLFLKFLIKFDFKETFICLPIDHPLPKSFIHTSPYSCYFNSLNCNKLSNVPMWIIDPLLSVNLTSDVSETDLISILEAAKTTLKSVRNE